ncbi:MAG: cell division FtsK/SpoIIIE [Chloroflexi bacterium]|nr:cell division FtsK/SpoIIIE [Chloroflexota bacterium]
MARSRTRKRPSDRQKAASTSPLQAFWAWNHGPDVIGLCCIALSLIALLALFWPDGAVSGPLGGLVTRGFGWLAAVGPIWLAIAGVLLISHRVVPRPWPWIRLGAGGGLTIGVLGLAALEAHRRGLQSAEDSGGGVFGRAIANALGDWLGIPSAIVILGILALACGFIASGLSLADVSRSIAQVARFSTVSFRAVQARLRRPKLLINPHSVARVVPRGGRVEPSLALKPATAASKAPVSGSDEGPDVMVESPKRADGTWKTPPITIFKVGKPVEQVPGEIKEQARIIEETLNSFNVNAHVLEANQGPAVTQFGVEPAIGVPVSRITARLNDLALRLGASSIRIEAPVPGRRMVGIEVPNASVSIVNLREVLESPNFQRSNVRIPLALGKDIAGKATVGDLARMPHLLIAGATGSGKSVCINSVVACLLSQFTPDELQLLMIDPKMVELTAYNGVPHLRMPVVTDMDKVVGTLKWATKEMERRYKLFAAHSARNIDGYNRAVRQRPGERPMPYLVIIIDELADLMMMAPDEVEKNICRLAQLARATGIHLILATQRPSVDVLTGLIKANFPTRIAFAVTSQIDSRVILDVAGAERLLGRGDMLYMPPDAGKPQRIQGTYVSDQEIEALVSYWRGLGAPQYDQSDLDEVESLGRPTESSGDELYERAAQIAQETKRISVSLLQRRLGIGYPRAARLVDLLEERGVISSSEDGRAREVLPQGTALSPD